MNGIVYLIRNTVNGKCYVGQTTRNFNERFSEHCQPGSAKKGSKLSQAIQLYGEENFVCRILEEGIEDERELSYREVYYVATLRTVWPDGYNATPGGTEGFRINAKQTMYNPEIVDAYVGGLSLAEVGKRFGVCGGTVLNHLRKAGVPRRPMGSLPGHCPRWDKMKGDQHGRA